MSQKRSHQEYALTSRRDWPSGCWDPFRVNPVRRAALTVLVSGTILIAPPYLLSQGLASLVLLSVGWLAGSVLVFTIPVLIMTGFEEAWRQVARRVYPSIDELDLSPRVYNLLRRHGFASIAQIERAPDPALLVLSNFDARALHEVRRAVNLWRYRRWQDAGFPTTGGD